MKNIYVDFDIEKRTNVVHPQKEDILRHLKTSRVIAAIPGILRDNITKESFGGQYVLRTDGKYEWTTELVYHYDKYNVELPEDFINFILSK